MPLARGEQDGLVGTRVQTRSEPDVAGEQVGEADEVKSNYGRMMIALPKATWQEYESPRVLLGQEQT